MHPISLLLHKTPTTTTEIERKTTRLAWVLKPSTWNAFIPNFWCFYFYEGNNEENCSIVTEIEREKQKLSNGKFRKSYSDISHGKRRFTKRKAYFRGLPCSISEKSIESPSLIYCPNLTIKSRFFWKMSTVLIKAKWSFQLLCRWLEKNALSAIQIALCTESIRIQC